MSTQKVYSRVKSRANKIWIVYQDRSLLPLSDSSSVQKWTDTVTFGDNIPDWRESLAAGRDTTTGMTVEGRSLTIRRGRLIAIYRGPPGNPATTPNYWAQSGDFNLSTSFSSTNPTSISDASANARALGKFVSRAREVNTAFQGGVFLGELAKTIHGIRHPAKGLRDTVDAYRSRAVKLRAAEALRRIPAQQVTRNLADLWLESSFHWRPLIHDVQDGARAAARLVTGNESRPETQPIRAKATVETNSLTTAPAITVNGGLVWAYNETSKDSCTVVYRGAVRIRDLSTPSGQAAALGFDPSSFAPTVWELVPYSFLIDYFTNVGEIVSGLSFPRSSLAWSNRTIIREVVVERNAYSKQSLMAANYRLGSFSAPQVVATRRHISRASYNGTYVPQLNLEVPGSGSLKWLNIAALAVAQASDRKFRWL